MNYNVKTDNMKSKLMKFFAMLAAVCIAAAGCTSTDGVDGDVVSSMEGDIASLAEQMRALESTVGSLRSAMETADRELKAELEGRIGKLETTCKELSDAIAALPDTPATPEIPDVSGIIARLDKLEAKVASEDASLAAQIGDVKSKLESKPDLSTVKSLLTTLETSLRAEITALQSRVKSCEEMVAALNGGIASLQTQIEALQNAVGSKVDKAEYDAFVQKTNSAVQSNLETLARLEALCGGFAKGDTVKGYIDKAVSDLESSLGSYVLKTAYETFHMEYKTFVEKYQTDKTEVDKKFNELTELIKALDPDDATGIGDLTDLKMKVAELESKSHALTDVYDKFTAECAQFKGGVDAVIDAALADGGRISAAVKRTVDELLDEYSLNVGELQKRVDELAGRMDKLESQMQDVIGRIQSLVYVPKTSDGMIHVGTTYIAVNDDDENRIELTPTKKLEYRVSPAELSEKLVELPLEAFSFWQEHVTRTEGDGMDEFHVRKVEAGNGPGEILITVENGHDFTYQNLAVALCIRSESDSGVTTEFTSPYTTVVNDGRNIYSRFYLAKRTAEGFATVYGDELTYLLLYKDQSSLVTLLGSDYEVVYDNGESIMSLDEAKKRFEWEVDLEWKKSGIAGAFNCPLMIGAVITPAKPNDSRSSTVTLKLESHNTSNIGKSITDAYRIDLTAGGQSVTLRDRMGVRVLICDDKYIVENEQLVVWNYNKWEAAIGRAEGDYTPYVTEQAQRIVPDKDVISSVRYNHLPESVVADMFPTSALWEYTANDAVNGQLEIRNTEPVFNGSDWRMQFTVDGYKYNDGVVTLESVYRDIKPAHMVGSEPIRVEVRNFKFDAPVERKITLSCRVKASAVYANLFYLAVSDKITNADKKLSYSPEEVARYFGGNTSNLGTSEFLTGYEVNFEALSSSDNHSLPVKVVATSIEETDTTDSKTAAAYRYPTLVSDPKSITPQLTQTTEFTPPANAVIKIKDGPSYKVEGSVTVTVETE